MSEPDLKIGQVAEVTGLSLRTIRYYEELGLVLPSQRTEGGFRLYDARALKRLHFLALLRPLGMSLDQGREVLAALDEADSSQATLAHYHHEVVERLERLRRECAAIATLAEDLARHLPESGQTDSDAVPSHEESADDDTVGCTTTMDEEKR